MLFRFRVYLRFFILNFVDRQFAKVFYLLYEQGLKIKGRNEGK